MSSTELKPPVRFPPLSLQEVTQLLIKHYGIKDGQFDLLVNFQIGAGMFGPAPDQASPGVAVSVQEIGLVPSTKPSHMTVDAAKVGKQKRKA